MVLAVVAIAGRLLPVREDAILVSSHTANAGELTGDVLVGQTFVATRDNLSGISVMFATYSGRENTEPVELHVRTSAESETDIRVATVDSHQLGDNQLYRFEFERIPDSAGKTYFFFVRSPGSTSGNAVTVDLATKDPYHFGSAYIARGVVGGYDSALVRKSGKPTVDVVFGAAYTVPLHVAVVNKVVAAARHFVATWDDARQQYVQWAQVGALALVATVLLVVAMRVPRWQDDMFLIGVLILALAARVLYASELPLTNDEGNYLYDARTLLQGKLAGGDGYVKAPLVIAWVALWSFFDSLVGAGQSILVGRLSSIIIGALTTLPLYFLTRSLAGRRAALAAVVLWALLGVTAVFNSYVHTQSLAIFFGVTGLAMLVSNAQGKFFWAGVFLGLGVVSRKSILALGLVPLVLVLLEHTSWREKLQRVFMIGVGFLLVVAAFLGWAGLTYGPQGFWEAVGFNSAEDGISAVEPGQEDQVRAYSLRGMTPFFRESLSLILLSVIGLGVALERFVNDASGSRLTYSKLAWLIPLAIFWWAWGFFSEYEGSSVMVFGMWELWYAMAAIVLFIAVLPRTTHSANWRRPLVIALTGSLWVGGLVFFYINWIKFHANYIGEFLPPLVLLSGVGLAGAWRRVSRLPLRAMRWLGASVVVAVLLWAIFASNYVTLVFPHTGTFEQAAAREAAIWARDNIPLEEPIFTGAAVVPYLSGHRVSLDIAHPRWYAYEFTRKDTARLNTFLPPAEEMVQAFREAQWFLMDQQTAFSFLAEYSEIEAGLEKDFESVKGISNGSNTLTFYRRVR